MRARVTVILALVVTALGCGSSSTGPKKAAGCNSMPADPSPPTTTQGLAIHLDSLQQLAATCGQSDRFRILTYPIAALAQNVTPTSVMITVNGTKQPYSAAGLEIVGTTAGTSPTPSDSFFVFVAWSDAEASKVFLLEAQPPDTLDDLENLDGAHVNSSNNGTGLEVSLASNGGACTTTALPFAGSNDLVTGTTCTQAMINVGFDLSFTATSTNPNSRYADTVTNLPSARIVLPATGGQLRVPHNIAALGLTPAAR
jgi:hypothetical protein